MCNTLMTCKTFIFKISVPEIYVRWNQKDMALMMIKWRHYSDMGSSKSYLYHTYGTVNFNNNHDGMEYIVEGRQSSKFLTQSHNDTKDSKGRIFLWAKELWV